MLLSPCKNYLPVPSKENRIHFMFIQFTFQRGNIIDEPHTIITLPEQPSHNFEFILNAMPFCLKKLIGFVFLY